FYFHELHRDAVALFVKLEEQRHQRAVVRRPPSADRPVHHCIEAAAELLDHRLGQGRARNQLVLGLYCPANELAPENRARHLIADMKAPAATLEALPVDDRQGCRAGADDDRAAVLAAE